MSLPFRSLTTVSTGGDVRGLNDLYDAYGHMIGHRYSIAHGVATDAPSDFANISVPGACATIFRNGASDFVMSPNQQGLDLVIFSVPAAGATLSYAQGGKHAVAASGEAIVHATDKTLVGKSSQTGDVTAIALPRQKLKERVASEDLLTLSTLTADTPSVGLFLGHARNLLGLAKVPDAALSDLISEQLCDLAALAIGASAKAVDELKEGASLAQARYQRAIRYIRSRLTDPALSEDEIAANLALSTSSTRRLFAQNGTSLARSIRNMRLDLAASHLADPRHAHRKILDIALDCGFLSLSAFYVAFQARFDTHPTDMRPDKAAWSN